MNVSTNIDFLELFQEVFSISPGSKLIYDQNGLIKFASKGASELFQSDELQGKHVDELIGEDLNSEQGHTLFIQEQLYILRSQKLSYQNYSVMFIEPFLREHDSQFWFSDLASLFKEPIWALNPDLKLINFNQAFAKRVEPVIKRPMKRGDSILYEEYGEASSKFWEKLYQKALTGEETHYELPKEFTNNEKILTLDISPIKKNGEVIGLACITKDVTRFKQQNQLLSHNQKKLKTAFKIALMSEWEFNFTTEEFNWIEESEALLGLTTTSLPSTWEEFINKIHPTQREGVQQAFEAARSTKFLSLESKITLNDKGYIWVRISAVHLESDTDSTKLIGVIQNIDSRKLVEVQLVESERKYKELISVAPAIIFQYNISTNTGTYYSGQPKDILGYTVDEMVRVHNFWGSRIHPEDLERVISRVQNLAPGELYVDEFRVLHKKGYWVWIKEYSIDIKSVKGNLMLTGISFDITKEKEYEKRLNLALESSQLGVFEHNLITDEFLIDQTILNMVGYSEDEIPATFLEVLNIVTHPDDRNEARKIAREVIQDASENLTVYNSRLLHKNGSVIYIEWYSLIAEKDDHNRVTKVIGTVKDVTEKRIQELKFSETHETLQKIIESVPGVVFRYPFKEPDKADFISDQIFELTGYRAEEFRPVGNISFLDLVDPTDLNIITEAIQAASVARSVFEVTYRLTQKNGHLIWVWERGGFIEIDGQLYTEGFMTDITDKVKAEDRIISATIQAEDGERNRISREIHDGLQQTLVSSLFSFQELQARIADKLDDNTSKIFQNALESLQNGVSETRHIAHRIMPKSIQDFGLVETLEYMINNLNNTKHSKFSFYHNFDQDAISDDIATSLYRICQEATNNILKYANASEVEIQLIHHQKSLILSIDDNGIGFDTKASNILFTGLGLSSMRSRANAISATFDLSSKPGKGTSIIVEVPFILQK